MGTPRNSFESPAVCPPGTQPFDALRCPSMPFDLVVCRHPDICCAVPCCFVQTYSVHYHTPIKGRETRLAPTDRNIKTKMKAHSPSHRPGTSGSILETLGARGSSTTSPGLPHNPVQPRRRPVSVFHRPKPARHARLSLFVPFVRFIASQSRTDIETSTSDEDNRPTAIEGDRDCLAHNRPTPGSTTSVPACYLPHTSPRGGVRVQQGICDRSPRSSSSSS